MKYRIKEHREAKNMSQEELADISGVSRATISKLENDKMAITKTSTLANLAMALDCKVDDLFFC